jgi:hypothetical protein
VTAKTADTITIKSFNSTTITIHVTGTTRYQARGKDAATLADVTVDGFIAAQGTLNADTSLNATAVQIFPAGKGLLRPFRGGGPNNNQKPNPSPTGTTTSTS